MGESLTWILGGFLGAVFPWPLRRRAAFVCYGTIACLLGVGATVINGEWTTNPGFALVDVGQVILASVAMHFVKTELLTRVRRRAVRVR